MWKTFALLRMLCDLEASNLRQHDVAQQRDTHSTAGTTVYCLLGGPAVTIFIALTGVHAGTKAHFHS